MKRFLLFSVVVTGFACGFGSERAHAQDITDLVRAPVQAINPFVPVIDISTAVPTMRDITAVPMLPRRGRAAYPVSIVRYGLNIYPSARVLRRNGLSLFRY
jgi:hypothetical protein